MLRASRFLFVPFTMFLATSCLEPTQIMLEITTDVPCATLQGGMAGVAITVGTPAEVEEMAPTVVVPASECIDGFIGTMRVVPNTSPDAPLGIKVAMSLEGNVETRCGSGAEPPSRRFLQGHYCRNRF